VERGNPLAQNPATHTVREAFRALEFRVVVDAFLTDTAREADLVLPAKSFVEQSDVIGAYWHPYVQLKQKLLSPPGEVKPESEIYWHLAQRLGIPAADLAGRIPAPSDAAVDAYLEQRLAPWPELSLERLAQGPVLSPLFRPVAFADLRFPTPSGRIELRSEEAAARWGVDPLPGFTEPVESPRRNDTTAARYPLQFLTPNTKNRIHSQFTGLAMLRPLSPHPLAELHPQDAAARGIGDGDPVEIFNARGRLRATAWLNHGIRPGCVAVSNGWSGGDGGSVNVCSAGRETDLGHGAAFHDVQVEVVRGHDAP
jgi:anaerobic selenocysteine-containing dehydrogenase